MEKKNLLLKPLWNYKEICVFLNCKKSKAYEIMNRAKVKFNGSVPMLTNVVKRDSVLASLGLSIEREFYVLNQMKRKEENGAKTL